MTTITVQDAATVMSALAEGNPDRRTHIAAVLDAVGEAFASPVIDKTPDDWLGADAALIQVQQWAHDSASRLEALIHMVEL